MMDEHTATAAPSGKISSLFGESGAQNSQQMHHNPFSSSSYYHQHQYGAGDDSGAGSEEGFDLSEEPAKPATHRSGSKRSRAADVHNLSEKRRRSRINEKMKALQNLIPNSNKTDKASMLDEAIEYLKQLQLQVQMLFMRNGLDSHPNLPGALHQLQACQLCMSFRDSTSAMNMAILGMLPHNPDSAPNKSFDLTGQCMTFHQTAMLPTASISAPETSFELEPLQSHHPSLKLQVPGEEIFIEDMVSQQQLDSGRNTRNLAENVMKTMDVASSLHFGGQASSLSLEHNDHLEDVHPKDHPDNNPVFSQNFNGIQTGRSFTKDNVKPETLRI